MTTGPGRDAHHTSGTYRLNPVMLALMIGGPLLLAAVSLALAVGWLPTNDPGERVVWTITAVILTLLAVLGACTAIIRIDWDADGLRIRMPGLAGISRRTYAWSDLKVVQLRQGYWRIDCSDGGFFRVGVGNMSGGAALLREIARRRIPADHDILSAILTQPDP